MTRQLLSITLALVLSLAATWAHAQAEDPVIADRNTKDSA